MQNSEIRAWFARPFVTGAAAGLFVLLLALTAMGRGTGPETPAPQLLPTPPVSAQPSPAGWDEGQPVKVLREDGSVEEMTMGTYLRRVVAAEMPAVFEPEALRAQAVCARTYALWKMAGGTHGEGELCDQSACCQAYLTEEKAEARWGELTETYTKRISDAVADTDGWILTYEGTPIQAVFFSSSTATTENARAVWGAGLPYLVSVDSPEGEEVPNYHSTVEVTAEELRALIREKGLGSDLSGKPSTWWGQPVCTSSGRVEEISLGGVSMSGGAVRSLLGLRSTCFTVEEKDGVFTFSVTGYGHGVGMSQYGANAMARAGSTWQDIVSHYYTGVTIEKRIPAE